jgi:hypothetical protein
MWNFPKSFKHKLSRIYAELAIIMSHTKKLWPGHTGNVANGNVQTVGTYSPGKNSTEITLNPSSTQQPGSQTGIPTSTDFSSDKSSRCALGATNLNQSERMRHAEQNEKHLVPCPEVDTCKMCERFCNNVLEKLDQKSEVPTFKIGDKVIYLGRCPTELHGCIGTIKDLPVMGIAWVDFGTYGQEYGLKLNELELYVEESQRPEGLKSGGSIKKDDNKYDPTMLTIEMVELVSKVRMFGAKKYARNNFKITGFKYTRSLAAALRHIFAFLNGEDNDPESGLSHLGHAICSLEHCIYDTKNHPENDDRKS